MRARRPTRIVSEHPHYDLGCLAQEVGQYRRAIAEYKREIRSTDYYKAHHNLGTIWLERRRYDDAIRTFLAAIRRCRGLADGHNNLGVAYSRIGQYQKAVRSYARASRLNPRDPRPLANLGFTLTRIGRYREAVAALRRALRLDPSNLEVLHTLGVILIDKDLAVREGVSFLEVARRRVRRDAQLLADLAAGDLKLGRIVRAHSVLQTASGLRSANQRVRVQIRRLQRLARATREARATSVLELPRFGGG